MNSPIFCSPLYNGRQTPAPQRGLFAKTFLIMRLTTFLLLATALQISATGLSQKISISGKNMSLEKVFSSIEKQSNYSFLYRYNDLQNTRPVDINQKNADIRDVLDACLREQHLAYTIENNIIAIRVAAAAAKTPATAPAAEQPPAVVSGTVMNEKGEPLAGVTILVKGTQRQALSNDKGEFRIQADDNETLVFTYVGYATKEARVVTGQPMQISLTIAQATLNDIVITALGIRRSEKSLTYATQQVKGEDLTTVKTDNLMNALNGKVAGLTISPSASGVGGSAKVILRGSRSANGNNQPLYVIDGIPISNGANGNAQPGGTFGGTPDGGDGISNLNPEDIASISVLEGASAAALYGSQAQNGVILITTKKGRAGQTQINFTSSAFAESLAYKPQFQNSYGRTTPTATDSWGAANTGGSQDNLKDFFRTGTNFTNALSVSGGGPNAQTYFSYANTLAGGVQPNNKLQRHNFTLRETARLLHDKLTVDGSVSYITQKINNSPALGIYQNALTGLYLFPRGMGIQPYKDHYLNADSTGFARQNWPFQDGLYQQNPWWVLNQQPSVANRNRILFQGSLRYEIASWLNVQVRGNVDHIADDYESDLYSGTNGLYNSNGRGHMTINNQTSEQKYGDAIINFNIPSHSAVRVNGLVGTSITDYKNKGIYLQGDLSTPDFFTAGNIIAALPGLTTVTTSPATQNIPANGINSVFPVHNQIQSVFGNVDVSWNDWAYLTVTGRNDWSSNLSFTPNESFFYPSVGLSVILSQLLHLPSFVNYGKVRGTYAEVGNTVPAYLTQVQNTQNSSGQLVFNTANAFRTLKPEKTKSVELGTEWRMFDNRLNLSFTWYKTNTRNQYFPIQPVTASLFSTGYVNAGNIQNTGIEFTIGYAVIRERNFTWNTSFNGALNRNKILDVDSRDSINTFQLTQSGNNAYESHITKGGQFGDIYGYALQKDAQGRILFSGSGTASDPYIPKSNGTFSLIGNPSPRYQLGWRNDFTYKKWTMGFLVDGKFGGHVLSLTQAILDQYGVSKETGDARNAGGVKVNGVDGTGKLVSTVDPKSWYEAIGGRNGISGEYIYSATVVRLREASIGYTLPIPDGFFKSIRVSAVGRNLVYFSKKAPFDPELTLSTGNGLSGVDVFNQPATRNFGLSINAIF